MNNKTYIVLAITPALTPVQLRELIRKIKRNAEVLEIDTNPYAICLAEYDYRRGLGEKVSMREIAEDHGLSYFSLRKHKMDRDHRRNANSSEPASVSPTQPLSD